MDRTPADAAHPDSAVHDDLHGVIADVERQLQLLRTYKTQHEEAKVRWQQVERKLADRQAELERTAAGVSAAREQLERDRAAAGQLQAELSARAAGLDERDKTLAEQGAALSRQRDEAREQARALAERERVLADQGAKLEQRQKEAGDLQARVAELEKDLASVRAELDRSGEAQGELIRALSERERKVEDYRQRRREAAAEAERRGAALAEAEKRINDLAAQIAERDARVRDIAAKHAAATAKLREVSQGLQEHSELVGRARQMEDELLARDGRISELEALLAEADARVASRADEPPPDPALLAERETLRLRAESLEEQLLAAQGELRQARAKLESAPPRGAHRPAGPGAIPDDVGEAIVTRWRRLRVMRELLREQAEQVRQAGVAVRARYEQTDAISRERELLARERVSLAQQRSRAAVVEAKPPRARPAALVALAIAVLAGLSWAVAGQVAPAVYAARASIGFDAQATSPTAAQLSEWQSYHELLMKDPALTDLAAERLGRRGIVSLSTPGALMTRLQSDLSAQSAAAGQLTLELRGRGAADTIRVLDTYITALASQANADRERRADGLPTVITERPSVGAGPIEDHRLYYAGGIFAAGAMLSFLGGGVIWRRLAAAKSRFEEELAEEATPADWDRAPQSYARGERSQGR